MLIQDGRIVASGARVTLPAGTRVVHTDGIIAPGLIDLHNHLSWNIFPRWKPIEEFGNRYDWQQKPVYKIQMTVPHDLIAKEGLECEAERYAEVKAITEGETSVTGSMHAPCVQHLTRNLDVDPELGPGLGKILYDVFPLQMSPEALAEADTALSAHPRGSLLIHLGEGAPHDAAAAREFAMLKGRGLLRPGVSLIHGVAITPEGFAEMAAAGVGLIWSPRSNVELYGDTANVAAAKAAGVQIALAPDWSPTGSDGLAGRTELCVDVEPDADAASLHRKRPGDDGDGERGKAGEPVGADRIASAGPCRRPGRAAQEQGEASTTRTGRSRTRRRRIWSWC